MDLITRTFLPVMIRQAPMEQLPIKFPQKRLTGYALLDHNKRGSRYDSKAELIKAAGYTRIKANGEEAVAFTDYYTALLEVKQYQAMVDIFSDANHHPSSSPAIRDLIEAIGKQTYYLYRTDYVALTGINFNHKCSKDALNIYHQKKLIAAVDFKRRMVVLRISEGSRSDKERLNRILMHFCGCNLFSRNKVWTIVKPFEDETKVTGYWTEVPFLSTQYPG
jgi:outer membrane receptor for Fe3+-dicitrate